MGTNFTPFHIISFFNFESFHPFSLHFIMNDFYTNSSQRFFNDVRLGFLFPKAALGDKHEKQRYIVSVKSCFFVFLNISYSLDCSSLKVIMCSFFYMHTLCSDLKIIRELSAHSIGVSNTNFLYAILFSFLQLF